MGLIVWMIDWIKSGQGFPCLFHLLTGLYCPGCGGTRAVRLFLKGELIKSFCYHPFVPYLALVLALAAPLACVPLVRRKNRLSRELHQRSLDGNRRFSTYLSIACDYQLGKDIRTYAMDGMYFAKQDRFWVEIGRAHV